MADKKSITEELFHKGGLFSAESYFGCTFLKKRDEYIYTFRTYAPSAEAVYLASDYNGWSDSLIPMVKGSRGIWECKVISPFALDGYAYKFLIQANGISVYKGDPYAKYSKGGNDGASVIWTSSFEWTDTEWLSARYNKIAREKKGLSIPLNAYTVYPSDFTGLQDGQHPSYRDLASSLVPYIRYMGYTHVRLLSAFNTEGDAEAGGMFSPSYLHGNPDSLKHLVNELHKCGIGIILDWNATHVLNVDWSVQLFDGDNLYGTGANPCRLNTSVPEVCSYILSSLSFIIREYHVDGVYIKGLDLTNNSDRALLNAASVLAQDELRDVIFITDFDPKDNGVQKGSNLISTASYADKAADYLSCDPFYRADKQAFLSDISFGSLSSIDRMDISGRAISVINGIHGSYDDKFRQLRAILLYYTCLPFKKISFMGTEFARFSDWKRGCALEWFMLGYPSHKKMRQYISALNRFYVRSPELWQMDSEEGFELISSSAECCTAVFKRIAERSHLFVAINMSDTHQCVLIPTECKQQCVFSSEENMTGERGIEINEGEQNYVKISLSPYSARIYKSIQVNNKIIL